jgi:hypothetical protein
MGSMRCAAAERNTKSPGRYHTPVRPEGRNKSDCHFAVQLTHVIPGLRSYSVAVLLGSDNRVRRHLEVGEQRRPGRTLPEVHILAPAVPQHHAAAALVLGGTRPGPEAKPPAALVRPSVGRLASPPCKNGSGEHSSHYRGRGTVAAAAGSPNTGFSTVGQMSTCSENSCPWLAFAEGRGSAMMSH